MESFSLRRFCRRAVFIVIYHTWWHLPSKTLGEINILMELLHSSWEVAHFLPPRPPGASMATQPPICFPYASQMPFRSFSDGSQMLLFEHTRSVSFDKQELFLWIYKNPICPRILMNRVFYKWNTKIGWYPQKRDLTGKYHPKITFLQKPWNDPTVIAVILVGVAWI